jgi:hypothetical protein
VLFLFSTSILCSWIIYLFSINLFDAGSAWENLALEVSSRGLVVHGMQVFDYELAKVDLQIPDNFDVMVMIAIGKKGAKDNLPLQLQEREYPTNRKPLAEIVMEYYEHF